MLNKFYWSRTLFILAGLIYASAAWSAESFYQGYQGEKFAIFSKDPDKNTVYIYLEGFDHEWDNKVFEGHVHQKQFHKAIYIEFETGLRLRPIDKYYIVRDSGEKTLINGSLVPVIDVRVKGDAKPRELFWIEEPFIDRNTIRDTIN